MGTIFFGHGVHRNTSIQLQLYTTKVQTDGRHLVLTWSIDKRHVWKAFWQNVKYRINQNWLRYANLNFVLKIKIKNKLNINHTKNTNVMHLILFIRQIFSSTCFEYQVLICRRIQLYVSSIWHRHSVKGEWSNITKT